MVLQLALAAVAFFALVLSSHRSALELLDSERSRLQLSSEQLFRRSIEGAVLLTENAVSRIAADPQRFLNDHDANWRIFSGIASRLEHVQSVQFLDREGRVLIDSRGRGFHLTSEGNERYVQYALAQSIGASFVGAASGSLAQTGSVVVSAPVFATIRNTDDPPIGVVAVAVDPRTVDLGEITRVRFPLFRVDLLDHEDSVLSQWPPESAHARLTQQGNKEISYWEDVIRQEPTIRVRVTQVAKLTPQHWVRLNPIMLGALVALFLCTLALELALIRVLSSLNRAHADSLREKELLMREVHHRVKNNFQVLMSLLNLQRETLVEEIRGNGCISRALDTVKLRIASMAEVHETIYLSERLDCIDLPDFIHTLVNRARSITESRAHVEIRTNPRSGITVSVDRAVPLGLLVNELVSNAFFHAFPEREIASPLVRITINAPSGGAETFSQDIEIRVTIEDNGIGFGSSEDASGLGLSLISALESQVPAVCERDTLAEQGTRWQITVLPVSR